MCVCVCEGYSKGSKPNPNFRFVAHFSNLHVPHFHRN